jgi:hypothetical protein
MLVVVIIIAVYLIWMGLDSEKMTQRRIRRTREGEQRRTDKNCLKHMEAIERRRKEG